MWPLNTISWIIQQKSDMYRINIFRLKAVTVISGGQMKKKNTATCNWKQVSCKDIRHDHKEPIHIIQILSLHIPSWLQV